MLAVILEKTIRIPRSLSVKAASVLKGFLNKNPGDRLGCHRDSGFFDIVNHAFFKTIDWEMVGLPLQFPTIFVIKFALVVAKYMIIKQLSCQQFTFLALCPLVMLWLHLEDLSGQASSWRFKFWAPALETVAAVTCWRSIQLFQIHH